MIRKQVSPNRFIAVVKEEAKGWQCNCCGEFNKEFYTTIQMPMSRGGYVYLDLCPTCRGLLLQALREEE
jgi:hypothetical protein